MGLFRQQGTCVTVIITLISFSVTTFIKQRQWELAPRALYVYSRAFWEAVLMVTNVNTSHRPPLFRLLPPHPCLRCAAALKQANMTSLGRSEDPFYEKIASIQQSMYER